jgi:hypothetical protein
MAARNDLYAAAVSHAAADRPVFPTRLKKQPKTARGFRDATTDPEQIRRWFGNGSTSLLAIPTGSPTGLIVLDIDGDDGWESLRRLEACYEPLPRTASVKTRSGGGHLYFKHPGGEVRCSAGQIAVGLDVRADGGYVIVPPSPGWEIYEEAAPAELPRWLLEILTRRDVSHGDKPHRRLSGWQCSPKASLRASATTLWRGSWVTSYAAT